jgi:hypothetical protein
MKRKLAQRALRLAGAAAIVASVAAGAAFAAGALTAGQTATNIIQACVKDNGDVRIVAGSSECKKPEHSISWNAAGAAGPKGNTGDQGPQGIQGPKGDTGAAGAKGAIGDQGLQGIQGAKGDKGDPGVDGKDGADGASLSSLSSVGSLSCTKNGEAGSTSITTASDGVVTITCVTASSSCGSVANGILTCGGQIVCNTGFADANGQQADGCEANLLTDVNNCGAAGHVVPTEPNSTPVCAVGHDSLACTPGFFDVNHLLSDGCESLLNCESVLHPSNGLGQSYVSCEPVGTIDFADASAAASAWIKAHGGTGGGSIFGCFDTGGGHVSVVFAYISSNPTWASWAYGGSVAGHVSSAPGELPVCPLPTDPVWS